MKYYWCKESINTSEIGIYPQALSAKNILDFNEFRFGVDEPVQRQFTLPEPILQSRAKETTHISVVSIDYSVFLVLKNYFIEFLKDFKIADFQSWNIDVHHKKQIVKDYSLFHLSYPSQKEIVDFEKSKFEINEDWVMRNTIGEVVKFYNYEDYLAQLKKHTTPPFLLAHELVLDFSKQENDILRLANMPMTGLGYYVSERLKNAIEEQKFTGFAFQEIEEMDKRIKVIY